MCKNSDLKSSYAARLSLQLNKQWVEFSVVHSYISTCWRATGWQLLLFFATVALVAPVNVYKLCSESSMNQMLCLDDCQVFLPLKHERTKREEPRCLQPIESPLNHFALEISGFSPAWGLFDTASDKTKQTHKARQDLTGFKVGCRVWT